MSYRSPTRQRPDDSDGSISEDELSSTGDPRGVSSQEVRCISSLSKLGQKFAQVNLGNYKRCEIFIKHHPQILKEDPADFLRVAKEAVLAGEKQLAKRCVQQLFLIRDFQYSTDSGRERHFRSLMKDRRVQGHFVQKCDEALKKIEEQTSTSQTFQGQARHSAVLRPTSPTRPSIPYEPSASGLGPQGPQLVPGYRGPSASPQASPSSYAMTSGPPVSHHHRSCRLSQLGHLFIQIPVNRNSRCREFLEENPEILDEDHELYISEALSALRGGNESEAESAIEKSIILRDYDRRRPEKVFQGLSQSLSSAMTILKERARREREGELHSGLQASSHPQQRIGAIISDLWSSTHHGPITLATSNARHLPETGEGTRQTSVGNHTYGGNGPRVQASAITREEAVPPSSNVQLRRDEETAKQELKSTQRVLKEQKQKVASMKQEGEAAKQELKNTQRVLKELNQNVASAKQETEAAEQELQSTREKLKLEKRELKARSEELHSTHEELQSREKELKGSKSQKQDLQREKKELDAARKLQLLTDGELREKEKKLNETKMKLDQERESIAHAKLEIEATRRLRGFKDATVPLLATAELPANSCLSIGIKATMEDKATQITAEDNFVDPAQFETPKSENESDINGRRYGSTVFGLLQSAATVFKTGIQQQQGRGLSSSSEIPFTSNDDSTSYTATDYLLETDTPTPTDTEDDGEGKDSRHLEGRWDRRRRKKEVIQGLKFRYKEVETREADVEAREVQVQIDEDNVKRQREIQRQRDRAAFAGQCHTCGIVLAVDFEFPG